VPAVDPPSLTTTHAADVIYALTNPSTYVLLTEECGWTTQQYIEWLTATLAATLTGSNRPDT
jgi:hypothetical protein